MTKVNSEVKKLRRELDNVIRKYGYDSEEAESLRDRIDDAASFNKRNKTPRRQKEESIY